MSGFALNRMHTTASVGSPLLTEKHVVRHARKFAWRCHGSRSISMDGVHVDDGGQQQQYDGSPCARRYYTRHTRLRITLGTLQLEPRTFFFLFVRLSTKHNRCLHLFKHSTQTPQNKCCTNNKCMPLVTFVLCCFAELR